MNAHEWRATSALSLLQALRMLGMFMILPVLELYSRDLPGGASQMQIGLAIGVYGLVQACLQIPFGMLSDRIGRKPVILFGLVLFAAGSFVAGHSEDIHWIIAGRALQGAGAISGAVSALLADVTRPQVRTTAMAVMGAGMGMSFIIALVLGPVLSGIIGVPGIFDLTGVLAIAAAFGIVFLAPNAPRQPSVPGGLRRALADSQLLRLDGGIFLLHAMMTTLFIAAPQAIEQTLGLPNARQWEVYLPVLLLSIIPVFPMIRRIEAKGRVKAALLGSIMLICIALLTASEVHAHAAGLCLALLIFFIGFNYLEGSLPSMISRRAPPDQKGAALGVYATSQFLGGFAGSTIGSFALAHWGIGGAFAAAGLLPLVWLTFAFTLAPPAAHAPQPPESST
ncbi:MFS transporter [Solimonas marina]|uniref:MFS transporter n=1 Tax=Solimonas marina TaxID=2714601 RepID=A0A969W8S6_9GAMM|nr:MFS transporter [Solimonas marina]NKF22811.1 MFS transporter [Solimonas marina]